MGILITGLLGVLMKPFFDKKEGIFVAGDTSRSWELLGVNLLGAFTIMVWSTFWSVLLFWGLKNQFGLKWRNLLRIEGYDEYYGLDLTQHGESAYPAEAWIEEQYKTENRSSLLGYIGNPIGEASKEGKPKPSS